MVMAVSSQSNLNLSQSVLTAIEKNLSDQDSASSLTKCLGIFKRRMVRRNWTSVRRWFLALIS